MLHARVYLPEMLLFLANVLSSDAQSTERLRSAKDGGIFYYNVRGPLELDCSGVADDGATIIWTKNEKPVEEVPELTGRVELYKNHTILRVKDRSNEDDFGNYMCSAGPKTLRSWEVRGRPRAKLPANSIVVERQNLKLTCKLTGKPYPAVRWLYSKSNTTKANSKNPEVKDALGKVNSKNTEVKDALGKRVVLAISTQGVVDAQLTLNTTLRTDEGWYTCVPLGEGVAATTRVRVKDMYAALWPFLGICTEVLVLCAIILVCEKRFKKHRLDDDDTDDNDENK